MSWPRAPSRPRLPEAEFDSQRSGLLVIRVGHLITGLEEGGAERRLVQLVLRTQGRGFSHEIISMTGLGVLGEKLISSGVRVRALEMHGALSWPIRFVQLVRLLRRLKPDVLHCWMYHANLAGLLAAGPSGVKRSLWTLTCSDVDFRSYRRSTRWAMQIGARFSSKPQLIIVNSEAGKRVHAAYGYDESKMIVIPNGFDLAVFKPDAGARASVRAELGIDQATPVIGMVARFDPMKDHETFFKAARRLGLRRPDVHFVLVGPGITQENPVLVRMMKESGAEKNIHLLGPSDEVPRLLAALDIACLTSKWGEGFPNVIGEAMACEVPCVVSDVGDAAEIVGPTGIVVAKRDPAALADAWEHLLTLCPAERQAMGRAARQRIAARFSVADITHRYEELYRKVVGGR